MAGRNHKTCGRCKQGRIVADWGSDLRCMVCGHVIYGEDLSKELLGFSVERKNVSDQRNARVYRKFV